MTAVRVLSRSVPRDRSDRGRAPDGFTLIEVLVAVTILAVVLVAGLAYVSSQTRLFAASVERTTALTRSRYVTETLQRQLRSLGTHLVAGQPGLVYAGSDVVSFSADFASNVPGDLFAVYVDPDAPDAEVVAASGPVTVPTTAFLHGTVPYTTVAGTPGPAELLTFYLALDGTTAEADDYALYRQVNGQPAELVSNGIHRRHEGPFFRYWKAVDEEFGGGGFEAFPDTALPLAHVEPYHLSPADTGSSAQLDSVRAISVNFEIHPGPDTTVHRPLGVERLVALPNAGVRPVASCGAAPLLGVLLSALPVTLASGESVVELSWPPAVDDGGGETDVVRYAVWRREPPATEWGNPMLSLPAGAGAYAYTDAAVASGTTYEYAVAAQDCTPTFSGIVTSGLVVVP